MNRVERWGRRAVAVCGMALCGLMLTACQLNGHVQVGADRSVTVDLLANDQSRGFDPTSSCGSYGVPPGLRVRAVHPDNPDGWCHITGTVSEADLASLTPIEIIWSGDRVVGFMAGQSVDLFGASGGDIDVTVSFPGPVLAADPTAQVNDTTARWTGTSESGSTGWYAEAVSQPALPVLTGPLIAALVGTVVGAAAVAWPRLRAKRVGSAQVAADTELGLAASASDRTDDPDSTLGRSVARRRSAPPVVAPPAADEDPSVWAPDPDQG